MPNSRKLAALLFTLIIGGAGLSACGQKGPLTMPQDSKPQSYSQPAQGSSR